MSHGNENRQQEVHLNKLLAPDVAAVSIAACAGLLTNERDAKTVFVTSEIFNGDLGGLPGSDEKRQAQGEDLASIGPPGT